MTARLRVATVGAGYFSRFQHEAWARMADVDLVAVCDREPARARAVADEFGASDVFTDIDAMLDAVRPDLVDIATPPAAHRACIEAAVGRGVPAVCQKPFCGTLADAEAMVAAADAAGVPLIVHENFRFQPWHRAAKRRIDAGDLGDVYQATFRLRPGDGQGPEAYLDRQPYFQTMERFLVHETAIHLIDTFRYLLGEVTSAYADLRQLNPTIAGEDAGLILLTFAGGWRAVFDGNRLVDHAAANRRLTMGEMWIEGSDAVLRLDGDGGLFLRRHGRNEEEAVAYDWQDRGFGGDCVYLLQRHVADHLTAGGPLSNSGRDYLANLRIEEAVYESARTGRRVTFS